MTTIACKATDPVSGALRHATFSIEGDSFLVTYYDGEEVPLSGPTQSVPSVSYWEIPAPKVGWRLFLLPIWFTIAFVSFMGFRAFQASHGDLDLLRLLEALFPYVLVPFGLGLLIALSNLPKAFTDFTISNTSPLVFRVAASDRDRLIQAMRRIGWKPELRVGA